MMGSKINAYLNVDFLLKWRIMREVDLSAGLSLTHFSNRNTKYPNAGLNTIGGRAGLSTTSGAQPRKPSRAASDPPSRGTSATIWSLRFVAPQGHRGR